MGTRLGLDSWHPIRGGLRPRAGVQQALLSVWIAELSPSDRRQPLLSASAPQTGADHLVRQGQLGQIQLGVQQLLRLAGLGEHRVPGIHHL